MPPSANAFTLDLSREQGSLRGVAGDDLHAYAAVTVGTHTLIEKHIRDQRQLVWRKRYEGSGGPIVRSSALVAAALSATAGALELRGNPGAVLLALDADGNERWKLAFDASEWALITAIAPLADGFIIGGSFAGTLRATTKIVSSAGKSDGFVARVGAAGEVAWLVRVGGNHADGVTGVAAAGKRVAITGTFAASAELLGEPFAAFDERSLKADVFVAELDANGARTWSASFGGKLDDSVAGVAIDSAGRIAVAATVREQLRVNVADIRVDGPADGLVVYFTPEGIAGPVIQIGGSEADELRAIAAVGDHIVVAGSFAGAITAGRELLKSRGGDDAFLAILDGKTTRFLALAGPGREEVSALAAVSGGFVAGVAHTAGGELAGASMSAPKDPMTGAALIVRPLH